LRYKAALAVSPDFRFTTPKLRDVPKLPKRAGTAFCLSVLLVVSFLAQATSQANFSRYLQTTTGVYQGIQIEFPAGGQLRVRE